MPLGGFRPKPQNHQGPFLTRGHALACKTIRGPLTRSLLEDPAPNLTRGLLEDPAPNPKTTRALFDQGARPSLQNHQGPFLTRGLLEDPAPNPKTTKCPFWPGASWRTPPKTPKLPGALFDQGPLGGPRPKPQNHQGPFLTRGFPPNPKTTRGFFDQGARPSLQTPRPPGALFDQGARASLQNHQGPFWPGASSKFDQGLLDAPAPNPKTTRGPFWPGGAPYAPKPPGAVFDQGPLVGPPPKPQNHQVPFLTRRLLPCSTNRPNVGSPRAPT